MKEISDLPLTDTICKLINHMSFFPVKSPLQGVKICYLLTLTRKYNIWVERSVTYVVHLSVFMFRKLP